MANYIKSDNVGTNYKNKKFTQNRIMGLPLSYPTFSDIGGRAYDEQFFTDFPLLHITPGNLDTRGWLAKKARRTFNSVNSLIKVAPLPYLDERTFYFKEDVFSYYKYLDVWIQSAYTKMMMLNPNVP